LHAAFGAGIAVDVSTGRSLSLANGGEPTVVGIVVVTVFELFCGAWKPSYGTRQAASATRVLSSVG
jgi:hypothetical protein